MRFLSILGASVGMLMLVGAQAHATVTVAATDSIYGTAAAGSGSTSPVSISLTSGTASLSFSNVTGSISCTSAQGCISLDSGGHYNTPDGIGQQSLSVSASGSLSGINLVNAGALVGVFINGTPTGGPPTTLSFTSSAATSFASLSPVLNQVFFIGDGLTGNGSGTTQTFYVPAGATALELGMADACNYSGLPSCYGDNLGSYSLTVTQQGGSTSVPEPSSVATMAVGLLGLLGLARKRRSQV